MNILEKQFGSIDGQEVKAYTISNTAGMAVTLLEYGCIIQEINVPDKSGLLENIVLGYDTLEDYQRDEAFLGAVIGRVGGRIKDAEITIDGETHQLPKNDGNNHIHGGPNGFHRKIWQSRAEISETQASVVFSYTSKDGEEGYPGNMEVKVTYTLNEQNELTISYQAVSDRKTAVNLTNHSYFNLSGKLKRSALEHELQMDADSFVELDSFLLPTGEVVPVAGSVFDFRKGRKVSDGIASEHPQIETIGGGYDHPFLLNGKKGPQIILTDHESGRKMEVATDRPAVIFFSGNNLDGDITLQNGRKSERHLGLCFETQIAPGNMDMVIEAGEPYNSVTTFKFAII